MEENKNLFEKLKDILSPDDEKTSEKTTDTSANTTTDQKPEGSGIFTTDGKELPAIEGGYTLTEPDSGLGDNNFTSQ